MMTHLPHLLILHLAHLLILDEILLMLMLDAVSSRRNRHNALSTHMSISVQVQHLVHRAHVSSIHVASWWLDDAQIFDATIFNTDILTLSSITSLIGHSSTLSIMLIILLCRQCRHSHVDSCRLIVSSSHGTLIE